MKKKIFISIVIICLTGVFCEQTMSGDPSPVWKKLDNGLDYALIDYSTTSEQEALVHIIRIDPSKFDLRILRSKNEALGSTVKELAKENRAIIAINGGFFDNNHRSIGLLVQDGEIINKMHNTSWWSIFLVSEGSAAIKVPREFISAENIKMAVQAGPRLIVNGTVPKLKDNFPAYRSAIGIDDSGKILIVATDTMLDLRDFASALRKFSNNAMALDGGSSTQLFADYKGFKLSVGTNSAVTNAIGVFKNNP